VHLVGVIIRNFFTMHGHVNVKKTIFVRSLILYRIHSRKDTIRPPTLRFKFITNCDSSIGAFRQRK